MSDLISIDDFDKVVIKIGQVKEAEKIEKSDKLLKLLLDTEDFQGNAVVNYTEREVPYTRIIEHKHFEYGTQPVTVITYEYPDDFQPGKEPYYPVNDKRNTEIYQKYKELAQQLPNVLFGGRLAQYAYADMDDTVNAALTLWRKQTNN